MNDLAGRRAFSLLELLIAAGILGLLVLVFFQLMQSSQSQMAMSANSLISTQVAGKVTADLGEEARINTTLLELMDEYPDLKTGDRVVEGQSVFFRYFKDRAAPWGSLDPGTDGGIIPSDRTLYDQMKPFAVRAEAKRMAAPAGAEFQRHLAEVKVQVDWQEKSQKERALSLVVELPSPVGPRPYTPLALDDTPDLQARIQALLFPDRPGLTLSAAVSEKGADFDLVLDLGRVAVIMAELEDQVQATATAVRQLTMKRGLLLNNPTPELSAVQISLARRQEQAASSIFNSLAGLDQVMNRLQANFRRARLGTMDFRNVALGLGRYYRQAGQIEPLVRQCALEYSWLLDDAFRWIRSHREEEYARAKATEGFRLAAALDSGQKAAYSEFIRRERERMTGKNPYWEKFFLRETRLIDASQAARQAAFPNLDQICRLYEETIRKGASLSERLYQGREP